MILAIQDTSIIFGILIFVFWFAGVGAAIVMAIYDSLVWLAVSTTLVIIGWALFCAAMVIYG